MRRIIKWAALVTILLGLFGCTADKDKEEETENIHYAKDDKQVLDIYTPQTANKEKHPVLIYIHGGGWTGGDKSNVASKPAFFTENGYVFVSVNYRLHPDAQYNDMAYDVAKAIKWVMDHADDYQMDQTKINVMGHSAGGHLAGLIATDPRYLHRVGLVPASLQSIVVLDGPMNMKQFIEAIPSYKKVFGTNQKVWTEASPLTYMNNSNLPPAFMVTRWENPSVYQFARTLNKARGSDFVYQVKNLSHSDLNKMFGSPDAPKEAQDMTKAVMTFLKKKNK
ncbi:alpha/beta hydrolase [Bacillus changyiensis]|uniref:alpha/beta hydrolase n=1 Tax=Bacillus changyiensis TaxID=3004103 RepID=UPI0022E061AD|nr:alpha/beta hydrolase [Bacillus changyiensis]MDA1477318.1 alpha/beta hydrolase [Bacillus changyiensis]